MFRIGQIWNQFLIALEWHNLRIGKVFYYFGMTYFEVRLKLIRASLKPLTQLSIIFPQGIDDWLLPHCILPTASQKMTKRGFWLHRKWQKERFWLRDIYSSHFLFVFTIISSAPELPVNLHLPGIYLASLPRPCYVIICIPTTKMYNWFALPKSVLSSWSSVYQYRDGTKVQTLE